MISEYNDNYPLDNFMQLINYFNNLEDYDLDDKDTDILIRLKNDIVDNIAWIYNDTYNFADFLVRLNIYIEQLLDIDE